MRQRAHRDRNQSEIVQALERIGCSVHDMAAVGGGFPDLVVSFRTDLGGTTVLMEIKHPSPSRPRGKDMETQQAFREHWRDKVHQVISVDEAVAVVQRRKAWAQAIRRSANGS